MCGNRFNVSKINGVEDLLTMGWKRNYFERIICQAYVIYNKQEVYMGGPGSTVSSQLLIALKCKIVIYETCIVI